MAAARSKSSSNSKSSTRNKLSRWQSDFVLNGFSDPLRIACTGVSAGKSRALAWWIIMQMCKTNGLRAIVIAQTHKALKRVLIRELQIVCNIMHISYAYNKSEQEFTLENGSVAFGYSGENCEALLGLSEIDLLACDEAAYLPEEAYQYASDRMRGGILETPVTRLISSPQSMMAENWFSAICKAHPDSVIRATAFDNPFTSDRFKQGLKDRYCEGSNIYRQQVLGEIFDCDVASQIVMRSDFIAAKLINPERKGYWLGSDFAGLGADNNTVVVIDETGVVDWKSKQDLNTQQKSEQIWESWQTWHPKAGCGDATGGYGCGPMDLLEEKNVHMRQVNFAQEAYLKDRYPNARTEMFLEAAQEIKNGFWVPDEIRVELLAMQVAINKRGQRQLLPKELAKKILGGRSPDLADALALAIYAKNHQDEEEPGGISAEKAEEIQNRYMAYFNQG